MTEIKFITFTDIHISDTNPQSRVGNYRDDILDKLAMIGNLGKKIGVDGYLCGGDLYSLKAPMRNSHQLNNKLIETFKDFGAPVLTVEGNHDLMNDSYENFDKQPLSVLYNSGALVQLSKGTQSFQKNGNETFEVCVRGFPFTEEPDLSRYERAKKGYPIIQAPDTVDSSKPSPDVSIAVLHLYATLDGGSLFKHKLYSYEEISQLGDDVFVLGHYHVDQGVQKIGKQHFVNVGAISRGSLSHDNINRIPKICLITCRKENGKISINTQVVKLKVKPASEVFVIEEKEKEEKKMKEAEAFVSHLKEAITSDDDVENAEDFVARLKEDKDSIEKAVLKKVEFYINEADMALKDIKK